MFWINYDDEDNKDDDEKDEDENEDEEDDLLNSKDKDKIENYEIDNYVILRNDNSPTYMLSVVVDDYDMQVNTIVRGDDHLNNSFRQYYLYEYLGWKHPKHAPLPLIHGLHGSKLL